MGGRPESGISFFVCLTLILVAPKVFANHKLVDYSEVHINTSHVKFLYGNVVWNCPFSEENEHVNLVVISHVFKP